MSAKKKKSLQPWCVCDSCNVIIHQRETTLHKEKSCPPNAESWIHNFIFNNTLYTSLELFDSKCESLRLVPKESRDDFILMPCHVLQLCKIPIGDPVLIKSTGEHAKTFVKFAWPLQEKCNEFVASLSREALELNLLNPRCQVKVSALDVRVPVAKTVTVCCENKENLLNIEELLLKLGKENVNKLFHISDRLLVKYYGSQTIFKITNIIPYNDEETKEDCFYLMETDTKWVMQTSKMETEPKESLIEKLGGLNETITELKDFISFILEKKIILSGLQLPKGILIHGPMGTGKTILMKALAEYFTDNVINVEFSKIFSKIVGETEKELHNYFNKALHTSPSIMIIDDLDVLCAKSVSVSEYERRIIATLSLLMDQLNNENDRPVVVLAATSKIDQIDKSLRSPSRFGKEVEIYVPNSSQRLEILKILLLNIHHSLEDAEIKNIAELSHGFVGADLCSLVNKALLKNYRRCEGKENVSGEDFQWALSRVKPSAMKEIMIEVPNVRWEDIGGQEELKLKLKQSVEWPLLYRESFDRMGITPPKGLLMFGPPGCSKTMIAKAIATESSLNFISVKGPELFSKWVGESERAVRNLFRRARQAAPSIVFIDELDAIGGERNMSSSSNVQERVLAQILTEMDGVEPLDNVTIVAATNRPDRIDSALLRPGRLDRIIYVPLPDERTRRDIFRIQFKKTPVCDDVVIDDLVERTEGYSGAEIIAVCQEAGLKALEEDMEADKVSMNHFLEALKIVVPRTPKSLLDMYENYLKK